MKYIRWLADLTLDDIAQVGGKNCSLGELMRCLKGSTVQVPDGFAITTQAYKDVIHEHNLQDSIAEALAAVSEDDLQSVKRASEKIKNIIRRVSFNAVLEQEIIDAYDQLCARANISNARVAVRSSASAEDLPTASFAGQQETFLNISGHKALLDACHAAMASLFTERAIVYRIKQGFDHLQVFISIGIQLMVDADLGVSGVGFSLDPDSGSDSVVVIEAAYGLGELIVQGMITPDEYYVASATVDTAPNPIVRKVLGSKKLRMVYAHREDAGTYSQTKVLEVSPHEQQQFALPDTAIVELARAIKQVERYYSARKHVWCPMDIEWVQDGNTKVLYIVQARPETVYSQQKERYSWTEYILDADPDTLTVLGRGTNVGNKIVHGRARILTSPREIERVAIGDIIITQKTDPDWVPIMQRAGGIITHEGGRTCHAAIVSRELGCQAIVGMTDAMSIIKDGQMITLDGSRGMIGYVYAGEISAQKRIIDTRQLPKPKVPIYINIGQPTLAFTAARLPVSGVGLARLEFVIAHDIGIHPLTILKYNALHDDLKKEVQQQIVGYHTPRDFYVQKLAEGIATIAVAFYPRPVTVRFSDFKSNEYRGLLGGELWEPEEENPMLGLRGASRYYNETFAETFILELKAMQHVRRDMGLDNVIPMVPFVRTVTEAQKIDQLLNAHNLDRSTVKRIMMCEIPANVLQLKQLSTYFDGFSIGSNDLTQLVLGVDRDNHALSQLFDERDEAVKIFMSLAIKNAKASNAFISICGQAPSDYPEFASFLIQEGIDALSLNIDAVVPFLEAIA